MCRLRNIALESVTEKWDRRKTVIPMCRFAGDTKIVLFPASLVKILG